MSKDRIVLDASAVLALLHREPGHLEVARHLTRRPALSAVNLAEVAGKQGEIGVPSEQLPVYLQLLGIEIVDLSTALAVRIGAMRAFAKPYGLSLGDLACLSLGMQLACPVLTADRVWAQLDAGVEVILIR